MNRKCTRCGSEMVEKSSRQIGKDIYYILYCEKCKLQVARSS